MNKTVNKLNLRVWAAAANLFVIIIAATIIFPILFAMLGSFKENMELMTSSSIIPKKFVLDNYKYVWQTIEFSRYTLNSLIVTSVCVVITLVIASMPAYVFSRRSGKMPGLKTLKKIYVASMFISLGPCTLYPIYKLVISMGMNNSLIGIIFTHTGAQVANIILIESYLCGIGTDYDEAATIDGCGFFKIYLYIIVPLIRPVLGVVALLQFRGVWNSYLMPMILTMGNDKLKTIIVAVVDLQSNGAIATQWSAILAGAVLSIAPVMIVYVFANKQFISGITLGGVKG